MDFGISLDPLAVSQRHEFDDSESEEEDEENTQATEHAESISDLLSGKRLIIGIGNTASIFLRSFISLSDSPTVALSAETVGKRRGNAKFSDQDGRGPREIAPVELYELTGGGNSQWVVCLQEKDMRVEYCNRWTEKVFDQGKPSHVVVYICRPLHEYFSLSATNEDTSHIIRILNTSSWPQRLILSSDLELQAPNSVKTEAASILTECEVKGVPCSAVILYVSSSLTETEKSLLLLPSLKSLASSTPLPSGLQLREEKEGEFMVKKLQSKKPSHFTNLYT